MSRQVLCVMREFMVHWTAFIQLVTGRTKIPTPASWLLSAYWISISNLPRANSNTLHLFPCSLYGPIYTSCDVWSLSGGLKCFRKSQVYAHCCFGFWLQFLWILDMKLFEPLKMLSQLFSWSIFPKILDAYMELAIHHLLLKVN